MGCATSSEEKRAQEVILIFTYNLCLPIIKKRIKIN